MLCECLISNFPAWVITFQHGLSSRFILSVNLSQSWTSVHRINLMVEGVNFLVKAYPRTISRRVALAVTKIVPSAITIGWKGRCFSREGEFDAILGCKL